MLYFVVTYFVYASCRFIEVGGWEVLNTWLQDCKESENYPVLVEMLKVFHQLPVTVELLKKNNSAKTIKAFSKSENDSEFLIVILFCFVYIYLKVMIFWNIIHFGACWFHLHLIQLKELFVFFIAVKTMSSEIVDKWMEKVRGKNNENSGE